MNPVRKLSAVVVLTAICFFLPGFACSSFERTAFNSLSASKAVVDQVGHDYNAHAIPQTSQVKTAIETARNAQDTAVDAFASYHALTTAGTTGNLLVDAQQKLVASLNSLVSLANDLRTLDPTGTAKLPAPKPVS
jgi:hypothetical protein